MLERIGNNIILTFNGTTRTVLFFEFSFKEVGDFVILYQNEKILFRVPKSDIDLEELQNINIVKGEQGEKGERGERGLQGEQGEKGEQGEQGVQGEQGLQGAKGDKGDTGERGADGRNGNNGTNGKDGRNGQDGTNGKDGLNGTNGLDGEQGEKGDKGDKGQDGTNGIDGISFVWSGEYELGEDYEKNEVVEFEGSSFIAIQDTDEAPIKDNEINREFWDLVALRGKNGRNGRNGVDAGAIPPTFQEITWDVTNDVLPIVSSSVNYLNIDFDNFNGDINLTGQLPTNLKTGARLILRKIDNKRGRITYNDGVIFYNFVKTKGDYIELIWNGAKFII